MISINMKTPHEVTKDIATRAKEKRLSLNFSQQTLSRRSGVSYGTLKKFEQTGQISLESLLKLAFILDAFDEFETLFTGRADALPASIEELLDESRPRKRGRT